MICLSQFTRFVVCYLWYFSVFHPPTHFLSEINGLCFRNIVLYLTRTKWASISDQNPCFYFSLLLSLSLKESSLSRMSRHRITEGLVACYVYWNLSRCDIAQFVWDHCRYFVEKIFILQRIVKKGLKNF